MSLEVSTRSRLGAFSLDASFTSDGRITGIFGRSGAGKTTLINVIAGVVHPEQGRVVVDGTVLLDTAAGIDLAPHLRRVGYVFQESRLFPHLSVRQNLLYGRWFTPKRQLYGSLDEVVELLGLRSLLKRGTGKLSGGERQRVAIGRALLTSPRLLLMDEPLASLDEERKQEVMPYFERLRDHARVPIVYVSHSVPEVARLATTLVLMSEGSVSAVGATSEVMGRIDLLPLTGSMEAGAVIDASVECHDAVAGLTALRSRAGELRVPTLDIAPGADVRLRIRARDVIVAVKRPEGLSALNILPGIVTEIGTATGPVVEIALDCGGERILSRLTRYSIETLGLVPGREVYAVIKSVTFDPRSTGSAPAVQDTKPGSQDQTRSDC